MGNAGHGLSIAVCNWRGLINTILIQIIILAVVVGILFQVIPPIIDTAMSLLEILDIKEFFATVGEQLATDGDFDLLAEYLRDTFLLVEQELANLQGFVNNVLFSFGIIVMIIAGYRVALGFSDIAIGSSISEFMATNSRRPVIWYLIKKFKQSVLFSLAQFGVTILLDATIFFAAVGFAMFLVPVLGAMSVYPITIVVCLMISFRYSLTAFWMPAMVVVNGSIRGALIDSLQTLTKRFRVVFVKTLLTLVIMLVVITLSTHVIPGLYAFGTILSLLVVVTLFFVLKCVYLREYYVAKGLPYFRKKIDLNKLEVASKIVK